MKRVKYKTTPLLIIILSLAYFSNIVSPVYSTNFESNTYIIKLMRDGSAVWIIESSIFISSEEDLQAFMSYVKNFDKYKEEILENFTQRIQKIVSDASRYVNRPMRAEDFNVSVQVVDTLAGKLGKLIYMFRWVSFSEVEDEKLIVGDVFIGGFYLYESDSLTIIIPEDYLIVEVYPPPDKKDYREVTWFGKKLFPEKTPHIKTSPKTVIEETLTEETEISKVSPTIITSERPPLFGELGAFWQSMLTYSFIILILFIVIIAVILHSKRKERRFNVKDADQVIEVLREMGGSAFQKQIVERTGFSKAKVSEILSALEKNGVIEKVKIGRSQLIVMKKMKQ
ncbi:MAG: DUF4897 domain-containing protein [Thaumarchaeota archaeon]|jgi:uncharacterized membrane protein|nr:DUF4897 domain-containing protein [Candidatus Geocrenenecus arthurdayi]